MGSTLFKKALAGCHLEVVALVLPQFVNRPLPILVGTFRTGVSPKKNGPPWQFWRQQAGGLLVFAKCLLEPFLIAKGTTNIGRGIEFFDNHQTPSCGHVGEAATTCIAATQKDRRGRMWTNEPAVVYPSSFVEDDEGRHLDSFVPVPMYEGTVELKINEEGVPINPMEGISEFLEMVGRGGMGINSLSLPRQWQLMLCCQAEGEAAKGLVTCQSPHVPESLTT